MAVFIDGCFWHGCPRCYSEPKSNIEFWRNKIARNKERRKQVRKSLKKDGWKVMEFWEHAVKRACSNCNQDFRKNVSLNKKFGKTYLIT